MSGIVIRSTKEVLFLSLAIKGPRLSPMIVTERLHNPSHERNLRRRPNLGKRLKRSRRHCLSKLEHLSLFQMVFACAFDKSSMAMRLDSFWTNGFLHCNATHTSVAWRCGFWLFWSNGCTSASIALYRSGKIGFDSEPVEGETDKEMHRNYCPLLCNLPSTAYDLPLAMILEYWIGEENIDM